MEKEGLVCVIHGCIVEIERLVDLDLARYC